MRRNEFNSYITEKNFNGFFIELGWNHVHASDRINPISIDEVEYEITPVADKQGFKALVCQTDELPQHTIRKKIDFQLRKYFHNYILIFTLENSEHQLWMVPVKTVEKRDLVVVEYQSADKADFLFSKVSNLSFGLEEETNIVDVTHKVHGAFEVNSEKITKDFYTGFRKQHNSFVRFIEGISPESDRQWYASVMLNRLMFCYFIQKKGFLNFDTEYLRNKLAWTKLQQGDDQFFGSFYKGFLTVLFHGGLNSPQHSRDFEIKYGRIPYLNGGLFDKHQLEKDYNEIDIPDKAFEDLFDFFDKWHWHLDTRITATGKDINPDVLGYIFEQYINDRAQMGAYYTKEDITEYISKNCILPFLMDDVAKTSSGRHFAPNGYVWQMLKDSGDKYIYEAVKKGVDEPLPDYIETGIDTSQPNLLERRARWNEPAFEKHALPTEIWRETVERRQRCTDLRQKIANGEITHINDFITYNLDIRSFVQDLLATIPDHKFILHFYKALRRITILDPTCGSGAFLFAALNILEPLYEICIARMQEFNEQNELLFREQLDEMDHKYRSNMQYFIYKSIILRNLYGVDIMHEATEIARLRLFLKMVAVVDVDRRAENLGLDPLPDIDFNIRCGNTLIGYATQAELEKDLTYGDMFANLEFREKIEEEMDKTSRAYKLFKDIQFTQHEDMDAFKEAKNQLNTRLDSLNNELNNKLYNSTVSGNVLSYNDWLASHQPFHWLAEFFEIIQGNGGFDVIIGNPPYVEHSDNSFNYKLDRLKSKLCGNLYGNCIERGFQINNKFGFFSFIVPVAITCSKRMDEVIRIFELNSSSIWFSNYDDRPGKLFEMIEHLRASIFIAKNKNNSTIETTTFSTKYNRWYTQNRNILFNTIKYTDVSKYINSYVIPKISFDIENQVFGKILSRNSKIGLLSSTNGNKIYFRAAGGGYFLLIKNMKSRTYINGILENVKAEKEITVDNSYRSNSIGATLSSNLFYWFYVAQTDCRNLSKTFIDNFPISKSIGEDKLLDSTGVKLFDDYEENKYVKNTFYRTTGRNVIYDEYYPKLSKPIIDEIDKVLAKHYGFTEEELDFIINYDIKYRMGSELNGEEEE
ncbi:MAG: SAM-dependent methyltransferase [Bacteroidia bacterium]|nr:SAM-dependent methyltransferase [Bacteroidia bacterium]